MIYSVLLVEDVAHFLLMSFLSDNSVKCRVTAEVFFFFSQRRNNNIHQTKKKKKKENYCD